MTLLAYSRAFWPLFLHVLGAMTLFGAVSAAAVILFAAHRRPDALVLRRAAFTSLLVAIPAWAVTLACAYWIESDEGLSNANATWLGIGHGVLEPGLVVLLAAIGCTYWWKRTGAAIAGRIAAGVTSVYLVLLVVAFLAMTGKWG